VAHSRRFATLLVAVLAATASAVATPLPEIALQAGADTLRVEVAATPQQRTVGLMGRSALDAQAGMLFVFERADVHCFWMKNTLVPLSIAFLGDDGTIVDLADMQPQRLDLHCPRTAVRYALELPQGGFAKRGLRPGMRVTGGPFGGSR
jgi:uncharacterized membrane protein (UPF0127 family)